jgi:hypothetical protein
MLRIVGILPDVADYFFQADASRDAPGMAPAVIVCASQHGAIINLGGYNSLDCCGRLLRCKCVPRASAPHLHLGPRVTLFRHIGTGHATRLPRCFGSPTAGRATPAASRHEAKSDSG